MKIKTEHYIEGLEYSNVLKKTYSWNKLMKKSFKEGWRVPTSKELFEYYFNPGKKPEYLWSREDTTLFGNFTAHAWIFNNVSGNIYALSKRAKANVVLVRDVRH